MPRRLFQEYGRRLLDDWKLQEQGQVVPTLIEWNRGAITDIVRRISAGVRAARPGAVITINTVPFDHARRHQGLDEDGWLRSRMIDPMVDMSYEDPTDVATLDRAMEHLFARSPVDRRAGLRPIRRHGCRPIGRGNVGLCTAHSRALAGRGHRLLPLSASQRRRLSPWGAASSPDGPIRSGRIDRWKGRCFTSPPRYEVVAIGLWSRSLYGA